MLAHVSDLHVSPFGDTFHDPRALVRRSKTLWTPPANAGASMREVWSEAGWRVLIEPRGAVRLIDPDGYLHVAPKRALGRSEEEAAAEKACHLEARRAKTLAAHLPSEYAITHLLARTPHNANLRLIDAARKVVAVSDAVFMTGDLTDDGDGYELVLAAFAQPLAKHRLFAVPGNHDLYLFPLATNVRPKPTFESKRASYRQFTQQLGLHLNAAGAFAQYIPEADTYLVGLDSCAAPQRRFFRHNGGLGEAQLRFLSELAQTAEWKAARHRIVGLHHHVVPLNPGVGRRAAPELGMRLDDATEACALFHAIGVDAVLHGHRHVSEQRQPAGCRFRIFASPSLTLGCRSGDPPSYWRLALGETLVAERVYVQSASVPVAASKPSLG